MSASKMSTDELSSTAEYLSDLSERVVFLSEAARVLVSSIDYKETFEAVCRLTVPRVADWMSINVLKPDGSIERVAYRHADPAWNERLHRNQFPPPPKDAKVGISQVMKTGDPILLTNYSPEYLDIMEKAGWSPELIGYLREMKVVSAIAVPMRSGDKVIGGLTFFTSDRSGRHYNERDLKMAQELALLAGMAIFNAIRHREAVDEVERMRVLSTMRETYIRKQIHDIRTPLTAISMLIELISRAPTTSERSKELVQRVRQNIERASQMLSNLLIPEKSGESEAA